MTKNLLSAGSILNDDVKNSAGEDLGKVEELMIDVNQGQIAYAVLSFGGFLGIGNKLFAIPWRALKVDYEDRCFILNINKERLENAPGFDKDDWPDMADLTWGQSVYDYYNIKPYWN